MLQQNQNTIIEEGSIIQAPTSLYPHRQFKLLERLGMGSEGFVYKAIPQNWGTFQNIIALKFQTQIKEGVKWFYQQIIEYQNKYESENASNYHPSNIIKIYDFFDFSFYLVTVMELGQNDLYQYMELNKNKLTLQERQSICLQILSSIVFIHSQNLFHRDIKPENYIMVGQQVKLIDFGLIKQCNYDQKRMTLFAGTKLFQAPELIEGKSDYTMAVDIWAMAFVFYEIINGSQLLDIKTSQELEDLIKQHISNQSYIYNKIDGLQISDEWKQTIKKMLHPDPNQRISAKDSQEKLSKYTILMNQKINNFVNNLPKTQAQQNFPKQQNNQVPFNGQVIPQQSVQIIITQQLTSLQFSLQQPNTIINLQQQKEQSIKQLSNIKDQIIKVLNQLENNPIQVLSTNSSDSSQENQKQNQSICKKELPPDVKQKLDEQKKMIQEIEEKCISNQDLIDLNQNLQQITTELQLLAQITQKQEKEYQEYQQIQIKVDSFREMQKMIMKKKMLEENHKELLEQSKYINEQSLQKEIDSNQQKISKLEQQMFTYNYLQNQKQKQQQIIDDLTKQITNLPNQEQEIIKQKDEILELRIKCQYQESNRIDIEKYGKQITDLNKEILDLQNIKTIIHNQTKEIQDLQKDLRELKMIETDTKNKKEEIMQKRAKLRELPNLKQKLEDQNKEIGKLQAELKYFEQTQAQIDQLNQQLKQLIEEKNLMLEKKEEEKSLQIEKAQYEKERKSTLNVRLNDKKY